jgi:hypothetical protein
VEGVQFLAAAALLLWIILPSPSTNKDFALLRHLVRSSNRFPVSFYGPQITGVGIPLKNTTENTNVSEEHAAFMFGVELVRVNMQLVYTCGLKGKGT